jgi:hypothetical protein
MSISLDRIPIDRVALFLTLTLLGVLLGLQASPLRSAPGLSVREQNGQLIIAWTRIAPATAGRLEIIDGASHTTVPVYSYLSRVTYVPRGGDVQVRLITGTHQQVAHFVGGYQGNAAQLSKQMKDLTAEARRIRMVTESELLRVSQIQTDADRLLSSMDDAAR